MLPVVNRLRASRDFDAVLRHGRRVGRGTVTVHLLTPPLDPDAASPPLPPRVGLVVSKAVGGSVVRHRVARRLRHLLRDRVPALAAGTRLVVRAAPPVAAASSDELARDLDEALRRVSPS